MKNRVVRLRALGGAALLVLGVICWFGYQWYAGVQAVAAERAEVLQGLDAQLALDSPDDGALSQLMGRIRKLEDHGTAPDLLAAQARVELRRGRPERARDLFLPIASVPGAAAADQGLAARILLRCHAAGLPDRSAAHALLEDALAFALVAYADSDDPDDLLRAWLAARRLSDGDRGDELAGRILDECDGTPAAALVRAVQSFSTRMPRGQLDAVRAELTEPCAELDAMIAMVELEARNLEEARRVVEPLLVEAAGVVDARWATAVVFHAFALGSAAQSDDRVKWLRRRDVQLDWLMDHAVADDPRRSRWDQMRAQR